MTALTIYLTVDWLLVKSDTKKKKGHIFGGVFVPCAYSHAGRELPLAIRVFIVQFARRLSNTN